MTDDSPLFYALHFRPRLIRRRLDAVRDAGLVDEVPNLWQLVHGVAYMYARLRDRPETVGLDDPSLERQTWRARLWRLRPLRGPALFFWKRAVNPLDHTGLGSSEAHWIRHLVGAHHAKDQFVYDLQLLALEPGGLQRLRDRTAAIVDGTAPDAAVLRDLVVYDGYHERLLAAVDDWLAHGPPDLPHDHADVTLPAFLTWCARQPDSPSATWQAWRAGAISFAPEVPA